MSICLWSIAPAENSGCVDADVIDRKYLGGYGDRILEGLINILHCSLSMVLVVITYCLGSSVDLSFCSNHRQSCKHVPRLGGLLSAEMIASRHGLLSVWRAICRL